MMGATKKSGKVAEMEINDLETLKILTEPTRLAILESMRKSEMPKIGSRTVL